MKLRSLLYSICLVFTGIFLENCSSNDVPAPNTCDGTDLTLELQATTSNTSCSNPTGSAEVLASGGQEPYQYKLGSSAFQSSPLFENLSSGSYIITVRDANGCEFILTNVDIENETPSTLAAFSKTSVADTDCINGNGSLEIGVTGGVKPYQFQLNAGGFGPDSVFVNLQNGNYSVTVKDGDNCTITVSSSVARGITGVKYSSAALSSDNVLTIFNAKCSATGCHPTQADLFTYNTAKQLSSQIKSRTQSGNMPPNGTLSAAEKAKIACWVDDGAPQ